MRHRPLDVLIVLIALIAQKVQKVQKEESKTAFLFLIVRQSLKKPPAMQVDNNRFSLQ